LRLRSARDARRRAQVENLEVEELVALNCTYLLSAKPAMPGCASRRGCAAEPARTRGPP